MAAELEFSVLHFGPFGGLEQAISEITYIDLPLLEFNECIVFYSLLHN